METTPQADAEPQLQPTRRIASCRILCYRRMHWIWSIRHKPIQKWRDTDAREFMHLIMRLSMSWISRSGGSRYLLKTRTGFAVKPINENWRPIVRNHPVESSASTSASTLGTASNSDQHRDIFMRGGRSFFDYLGVVRNTAAKNPFNVLKPGDFEVRLGWLRKHASGPRPAHSACNCPPRH